MQYAMKQWPVSEELIVIATMLIIPLIMLAAGLILGSRGLLLLSFTVGPAIGWPIGVMLMGVAERRAHPGNHLKDPA